MTEEARLENSAYIYGRCNTHKSCTAKRNNRWPLHETPDKETDKMIASLFLKFQSHQQAREFYNKLRHHETPLKVLLSPIQGNPFFSIYNNAIQLTFL